MTRDGARYCTGCGAYETAGRITHDHDCVVKIAQDVLTGLVTPNAIELRDGASAPSSD